ncbi:hypothetical protein Ddye_008499 [Dipteronia dyeriana]|uniref:HAT C-terminal dimerisation domain-containing protein n=1 Tax=Dipteronia dyeriana TaxID=168575 RepID=A0AAD9X9X1_9ROSI|nr:hypothetical protein Ddye_008499 [Dipteronia dyeriana]
MEFVMFVYKRLYGAESKQLEEVKGKLFALFNEYVTSLIERSTIRHSPPSYPNFWKGNEPRYPELAAMARDVLSVPISTVASK